MVLLGVPISRLDLAAGRLLGMTALLLGWLKQATRRLEPALVPFGAAMPRGMRGSAVALPIRARLLWRGAAPIASGPAVLACPVDDSRNLPLAISLPGGRAIGRAALRALRGG